MTSVFRLVANSVLLLGAYPRIRNGSCIEVSFSAPCRLPSVTIETVGAQLEASVKLIISDMVTGLTFWPSSFQPWLSNLPIEGTLIEQGLS